MTYTYTWGGRLTTEVCAPKDGNGKPVPNATFQLYLIGTTTPPAYFSDRALTTPRSGNPSTDSFGNLQENWYVRLVDSGNGPGNFDYWYQGQHFGTVTIQPDPGESDDDIATAVANINTNLSTNYYTKTEVDANIASGGGPVVGAELIANKNQPNGYIGADPDGLAAYAQLPTTVERTTNKNAANGYIGGDSAGKLANSSISNIGKLIGTHIVSKSVPYTAAVGDFVLCDTTGGTFAITLPTPVADQPPISVKFYAGTSTLNVTGAIEGSTQTLNLTIAKRTITFAADGSYWYRLADYIDASILARLDVDNDFADHVNSNYRNNQATFTGATLKVGTATTPDIGWGRGVQLTNAGGCTVTLSKTAKVGDWVVIGQGSSGQDTIAVEAGGSAYFVEPDSYSKTAKQNARLYIECIANADGNSAGFIVSGYSGA